MIETCQELATQPCLQEQQVDERNSFYWGGGCSMGPQLAEVACLQSTKRGEWEGFAEDGMAEL